MLLNRYICSLLFLSSQITRASDVEIANLEARYLKSKTGIHFLSTKCTRTSKFTLEGPCQAVTEIDIRVVNGVFNGLERQLSYSGFVPHYTHSDGIRHIGYDENTPELVFISQNNRASLTLQANGDVQSGAGLISSNEQMEYSPDILAEGRTIPSAGEAKMVGAFKLLPSGHYTGRFDFTDGSHEDIEVAPEIDWIVQSRRRESATHEITSVTIDDIQKVSNIILPSRVTCTTFKPDNSVYAQVRYEYSLPVINIPVKLWVPTLPANEVFVASGSRAFMSDKNGKLVLLGRKRHAPPNVGYGAMLQYLSLAGLIGSSGILIARKLSKYRKTPLGT